MLKTDNNFIFKGLNGHPHYHQSTTNRQNKTFIRGMAWHLLKSSQGFVTRIWLFHKSMEYLALQKGTWSLFCGDTVLTSGYLVISKAHTVNLQGSKEDISREAKLKTTAPLQLVISSPYVCLYVQKHVCMGECTQVRKSEDNFRYCPYGSQERQCLFLAWNSSSRLSSMVSKPPETKLPRFPQFWDYKDIRLFFTWVLGT